MNDLLQLGNHFICEFSGCDQEYVYNNDYIREVILGAARESRLTVVGEGSFAFNPHGFTYYLLLAESHASIHVWPEYAYCAVDLFTCNLETDVKDFVEPLARSLRASEVKVQTIVRGCPTVSLADSAGQPFQQGSLDASTQPSADGV